MALLPFLAYRSGDGLHRAQEKFIRKAAVGQTRGRRDEERNIGCDGFAVILRRAQAATPGLDHVPQQRFVNRRKSLVDFANLFGININTDHFNSACCQRRRDTRAELA
jgi:hypothetical protein